MGIPNLRTPLLVPAIALSGGSLAWTTWSLVDLLGAGHIGITVAAGADIIWASVILAEARGLTIRIKDVNIVPAIGWAALVLVGALLAWHGIDRDAHAMAVAGPLLPLGAKVVWLLALADMRDPSALTDDERARLAAMERGMRFEEAEHRIELRRREMGAERLLADVSVDFEIELARQEKGRELARRAPIAIAPITPVEGVREQDREPNRTTEPAPPAAASRLDSLFTAIPNEPPRTSTNTDREQKSITELAREFVPKTSENAFVVEAILDAIPEANKDSVAATVRRVRKQFDARGGYA